ncbi:MAG: glutamate-1-semialdehyde 2,1-aminomutase [Deltaproteobacteria bacterium]|nr:glutamate-1-semialdehyde 2,1-aminomutase [Deltaproteobacteria bacterium]
MTERSTQRSEALFETAQNLFPGGVNSPVRAFKAVGGKPVFLARAKGAYLWDADGNKYIDFMASWGPMILGHADPDVHAAIVESAAMGTSFGASTEREILLGEEIRRLFPSMERMRFVSSGTEATMSALRLARGFTGRNKIIKTEGAYHGHADMLLVAAGSGVATLGLPGSAGVTNAAVADSLIVPFNNLEALEAMLQANRDQVAALILEPVPGNMGLVEPHPGYLEGARKLCDTYGALLIFDEVITGFRVGLRGAQGRYGIKPDLTCLGKIVGGGLPVGAYGGRADIMAKIAPEGPVYQAGTLSGNPLAMAAGLATIKKLSEGLYECLDELGARLEAGLNQAILDSGVAARVQRLGSAFTVFFTRTKVVDFATAKQADAAKFGRFFHGLLELGLYLPPAQLEAGFISAAHTTVEIDALIAGAREVLPRLA